MNYSDAKKLIKKIKTAYQVSTNPKLASKVGLTVSAIEQWSKKNKVPEKYIFQCIEETGVSLDWLLDEDKPTFHISGGSGVIGQQTNHGSGGLQNTPFHKAKEENNIDEAMLGLFKENDPVFLSFKKAYESVKNEKNKLNELEDLLENFYRKYR